DPGGRFLGRLGLRRRRGRRDRAGGDVHAAADLGGAAPVARPGGLAPSPRPAAGPAERGRSAGRVPARAVGLAGGDHATFVHERPGVQGRQHAIRGGEVIKTPHVDWFALAPELFLLGAAGVALMAAVLLPRRIRRDVGALAATAGFTGAFVDAILVYVHTPEGQSVIADSPRPDRFGALAQVIVCGAGLLTVGVAFGGRMREHIAEFYALLAVAGAGMCFFVTANNLMTLFLGLEWFSISLYILCAIDRELEGSLEAGLKY